MSNSLDRLGFRWPLANHEVIALGLFAPARVRNTGSASSSRVRARRSPRGRRRACRKNADVARSLRGGDNQQRRLSSLDFGFVGCCRDGRRRVMGNRIHRPSLTDIARRHALSIEWAMLAWAADASPAIAAAPPNHYSTADRRARRRRPDRGLNCSMKSQLRPSRRQRLPVHLRLERRGGLVDRTLAVLSTDQHEADRQAIDAAARQTHRRMVSAVERRGVW